MRTPRRGTPASILTKRRREMLTTTPSQAIASILSCTAGATDTCDASTAMPSATTAATARTPQQVLFFTLLPRPKGLISGLRPLGTKIRHSFDLPQPFAAFAMTDRERLWPESPISGQLHKRPRQGPGPCVVTLLRRPVLDFPKTCKIATDDAITRSSFVTKNGGGVLWRGNHQNPKAS